MTEPAIGPDGEPAPAGFDFSQLRAEVPADFGTGERRPNPDLDATPEPPTLPTTEPEPKAKRRGWSSKPAGDRADPKPKPDLPPKRKGQFVKPLTQLYTYIGMGVCARDFVCGSAIIKAAPECANALDELAYNNDAVRRVLWSLIRTSQLGVVIAAHMPIIMAIAMHHVPAVQGVMGQMGAEFADTVEDQLRTDSGAA